jgi:hypothetical protein
VFGQVEALHSDFSPLRVEVQRMDIQALPGDGRQGLRGVVRVKAWAVRGKHRRRGPWMTLTGSGRLEIAAGRIVGGEIHGSVEKVGAGGADAAPRARE